MAGARCGAQRPRGGRGGEVPDANAAVERRCHQAASGGVEGEAVGLLLMALQQRREPVAIERDFKERYQLVRQALLRPRHLRRQLRQRDPDHVNEQALARQLGRLVGGGNELLPTGFLPIVADHHP